MSHHHSGDTRASWPQIRTGTGPINHVVSAAYFGSLSFSLSVIHARSVHEKRARRSIYIYTRFASIQGSRWSKKGSTRLAAAKKWWIRVRNEARWRGRSMLPAWHIQSYEGLLSAVMTIGRQMAAAIKTRLTAAPYSPYNTFLHPSLPLLRSLSPRPSRSLFRWTSPGDPSSFIHPSPIIHPVPIIPSEME